MIMQVVSLKLTTVGGSRGASMAEVVGRLASMVLPVRCIDLLGFACFSLFPIFGLCDCKKFEVRVTAEVHVQWKV